MATETTNGTATTGGTLDAEERARLTELAARIRTEVEAITVAAKKTVDHGREAGLRLEEAHALCDKGSLLWGQWVKVNTTITQQYANKLRKLAFPEGWARVEAALAARTSRDRPLTIADAVRIASGKGGGPRNRRVPITTAVMEGAITKARLKDKLSVTELKRLLKELGIPVKKEKHAKAKKTATA